MRYYNIMKTIKRSGVLFTIFLLFQADLYSQQWSEPEIIFNKRRSLEFNTVLDSKGRIHLVIPEDHTGDIWPDSLHCYIRENDCWQHIETFGKDTLKMPLGEGLAMAVDKNDKVHLLWGMLRGTEALAYFHVIYYKCFSDNKWSETTQLYDFQTKFGTHLRIHVLPDQRVYAYWYVLHLSTIYSKFLIGDQWQPALINPLPQYGCSGNGNAFYPSIVSGPGDSLHIAFIGSLLDFTLKPGEFGNFVNYACKGLNDTDWKIMKLVYRNPPVPCHSPQIQVTKDGCRHIFWLVDDNADYFPDNIYYAYSFDGETWSEAINMTHNTPIPYQFIHSLNVKQDSYGQLYVVWLYTVHPFYYSYRQGREDKWSDPVPIFQSDMSKKKSILDIDSEDKLHFFWLEEVQSGKYDSLRLKYATAQLAPVSVAINSKQIEHPASVEDFWLTCYPNPVNSTANIIYNISTAGNVTLSIYDITGRKIKDLISGFHQSGRYQILFSSDNFSTGMYFLQLRFGHQILTNKILVIK